MSSSQGARPYGTAIPSPAAPSPQPYGTAIPIGNQVQAPRALPSPSPYGSAAPSVPQPRVSNAPGIPYRPVPQGGQNVAGYSPSQARGQQISAAGSYATSVPNDLQQYTQPMHGPSPIQQQVQRAAQVPSPAPAAAPTLNPNLPMAQPLPGLPRLANLGVTQLAQPAPAPAQAQAPTLVVVHLDKRFDAATESTAAWSKQGVQEGLSMVIQGGSFVFQKASVISLHVHAQRPPQDLYLRVQSPLTQEVLALGQRVDGEAAVLSLVKAVEAGEVWQVQAFVPALEEGEARATNVHLVATLARLL
jgi:hypothetical protein